MDGLWALEHSQYSENNGLYAWHIAPLKNAIEHNLRDCQHNNRGPNKWQIVYIGSSFDLCKKACDELRLLKKEKHHA